MKAAARRGLLFIGVGLILLLGGIAMFQDHLLYFPAREALARMVSPRLAAWPSEAGFRGLLAEPAGAPRATVIVFHGNAGHAGHRAAYADALTRLGLRVILAEYPGYGPRGGALGEASLVADAAATLAFARRQFGAPLIVVGESLGAGVAAAAAAANPGLATGLILITPWDRLQNIAAHHYPWLPVAWLLRDRYDSAAALASFDGPVWVAVAARDDIVPPRFGLALHEQLRGQKRLSVVEDAGHNDWMSHVDGDWWQGAIAFVLAGTR